MYSEEDDIDRLLARMLEESGGGSPASRQQPQASALDPVLARMSSYQPNPRDAALGERWRDEEERTLSQLEGGNDYGIGELLRDVLPGAVGIFGDAVTNEGRGIGNISMQMLAQADANAQRDQQRQNANREYALKQRAQREQGGGGSAFDRDYKTASVINDRLGRDIQTQNLGYRGVQLNQGERRTQIAEDTHSYNYNPEDKRAVQLVDDLIANGMGEGARGLPTEALKDRKVVTDKEVDHAFANIEANDDAAKTAKNTQARIEKELELAPQTTAVDADKAAKVAAAGTGARIKTEAELAPVSAATDATKTAATTSARAGAESDATEEGFIPPIARAELDPERVRLIARNSKSAEHARTELDASGEVVSIIQDMIEIRKKEAQGLMAPGSARSFFDSSRGRLEGQISLANAMGTLQDGDRRAIGSYLGSANASWTDLSGLLGSDVKLDQLEGVLQTFLTADQRAAQKYGYGEFGTAPTKTMARQVDRPAPRAGAPGPSASSGAAPPVAPNDGLVTVRLNGQTMRVDPERAKRFKVMDPSVVIEGM